MSKNIVIAALGAVVALGISAEAFAEAPMAGNPMMQQKTKSMLMQEMPRGFEKCYGIAKAGKNDCASHTSACAGQVKMDNAKDAWIGLPKGTCSRIVGGSTTEGTS